MANLNAPENVPNIPSWFDRRLEDKLRDPNDTPTPTPTPTPDRKDEEGPTPQLPQPPRTPIPTQPQGYVPDYVRMYNQQAGLGQPPSWLTGQQQGSNTWWGEGDKLAYQTGRPTGQEAITGWQGPYGGMNPMDWRAQQLGLSAGEGLIDARGFINDYYASLFGVKPQPDQPPTGGGYGWGRGGGGGGEYPKQPLNPWFAGMNTLNANR